jgi:hypothetical protein
VANYLTPIVTLALGILILSGAGQVGLFADVEDRWRFSVGSQDVFTTTSKAGLWAGAIAVVLARQCHHTAATRSWED